ncbi:hypothetical protein ABIA32_002870 [Streptacidiphilus sp. MAP12-20]|uniref:DUF3159 domain-containing protein n=1 Tax=Streptacidiphilus sp. MAP12-20 TaxID=3156299 RepID=UPI003512472B
MSHRSPGPAVEAAPTSVDTSLIDAFGGVRGMVEMTIPGLVFVVLYTITQGLAASTWSAVGVTVLLVVWRLLRKETLKHAFGGVLGVGIGAFIAMQSGKPQDFYLPSMLYGLALMVAYAVSALVRWPLLGLMLGPVLGENMTWRTQNPGRLAAYTKATWVWVALFALRAAILFPLYWAGQVTWLGVAKIGLGVPPWLVAIYLSWLILSKAPPPIKVNLDADADDNAGTDDNAGADENAGAGKDAGEVVAREAERAVDEAVDDVLRDLASGPVPQRSTESRSDHR